MSQNNLTHIIYIGIDIAKLSLEADPAYFKGSGAFANDPKDHQKIIKTLRALQKKSGIPHVVLEATGGYEQGLVDALHRAEIRVSVVVPHRVRCHARSLGQDAKTDRIDAGVLSSFGKSTAPQPTPPPTRTERELRELCRRRNEITDLRTQELNRKESYQFVAMQKTSAQTISLFTRQIATIDKAIVALRKNDVLLQAKMTRLCKIQGVGAITAAATLAALPELGTLSREKISALAGLAPKNNDSGPFKGRRYIQGGRAQARRALYMAAVSAARCNPVLQPLYARLIRNHKNAKVALVAVMRRLLVHMNSQMKSLLQEQTISQPGTDPIIPPCSQSQPLIPQFQAA